MVSVKVFMLQAGSPVCLYAPAEQNVCIISHVLLPTSALCHSHWLECACTEAHMMPKQQ